MERRGIYKVTGKYSEKCSLRHILCLLFSLSFETYKIFYQHLVKLLPVLASLSKYLRSLPWRFDGKQE